MEPAAGHTKEKCRRMLSPLNLLKVYSCCFARAAQKVSSESSSSIIDKAIRNDKDPPFASTWMEPEGIMLSEVIENYQVIERCDVRLTP
ncbi:hypothetical protein VULLAG_LOCUS18693 [Vulpes lagopus]